MLNCNEFYDASFDKVALVLADGFVSLTKKVTSSLRKLLKKIKGRMFQVVEIFENYEKTLGIWPK